MGMSKPQSPQAAYNARKRAALNEAAQSLGFATWGRLETAVAKAHEAGVELSLGVAPDDTIYTPLAQWVSEHE